MPDSLELAGNPGGAWLTLGPATAAPQGPVKRRRAARLADPALLEPLRFQIPLAGPSLLAASLVPGDTGTATPGTALYRRRLRSRRLGR